MVHQDAVRKVGKAADVHQLVLARMVEAQDASAAIFSLVNAKQFVVVRLFSVS